ncbi:MAG: cell division protein ZapE [Pseudomarimonas sp.]
MIRAADTRPIAPGTAYAEGVSSGRWDNDPAQRAVLVEFDRIFAALQQPVERGLLDRLRGRRAQPVRGLYCWGGVGRGKTFLVDLFFEHLPIAQKRRVHFHRFMGEVHARLRDLGQRADPLQDVAEGYAGEFRVLCLDEFFVSDIGDAMIVGRLLEALFARGVCLITTSNTVPSNLYRDGLQRARFLPAIALIERHCVVHQMASQTDYRLRTLTQAPVYHHPLNEAAERALEDFYERLTADTFRDGLPLLINERLIPAIDFCEGVAWFEFTALCEGPRSVADYIEIARDFHTVLLARVPQFGLNDENAARRFVNLVDEFYDRNVNLILSVAVPLTDLYVGDKLSHEFQRTQSRLIEMQSEAYLAREHRP